MQVLYQHLSQPCIDLNWAPNGCVCPLTDAISHSLRTPGALLYECCKVRGQPFEHAEHHTLLLDIAARSQSHSLAGS